jgi:hypothetical protein
MVALALYRALPEQKEYLVIALCGAFQLVGESGSILFDRLKLAQSGVDNAVVLLAAYFHYALQYDVVLRLVGVRPGAGSGCCRSFG